MTSITSHEVTYSDNKKIHYLASGPTNGPLILFIHGWPATAITWKAQIDAFAALGFRAIAPDMPGYGKSTARRQLEDYSQEALVEGMLALLYDTGRKAAIWVGHDWGAGVTSSVAGQHPEVVKALVNICVPYRTLELGWKGFLPFVNREYYPDNEYGQWDYMKSYEEDFENHIKWFDQDPAGFCKATMQRHPNPPNRISVRTSAIRKTGWMNGAPKPPSVDQVGPSLLEPDVWESFSKDMNTTGFYGGGGYYMNHERNAKYGEKVPNGGKLKQPVLFIHATYDMICDTKTSRLMEPMREACSNLTEVTIETGHWVQFDRPAETNAALFRFIVEELPSEWPGYWDSGYVKRKSIL